MGANLVPTMLIKLSHIASWTICSKRWRTWISWRSPLIINASPRLQCVGEIPLLLELLGLWAKSRFARVSSFLSDNIQQHGFSSLVEAPFLNTCLFKFSSSQDVALRECRSSGKELQHSAEFWLFLDHSWNLFTMASEIARCSGTQVQPNAPSSSPGNLSVLLQVDRWLPAGDLGAISKWDAFFLWNNPSQRHSVS